MGERGDRAARQSNVGEPRSECVVSVPLAGDGLEIVDVSGDLAIFYIKVNAGPCDELVNYVEEDGQVLHRVSDESSVVRVTSVGKV